MPLVRYYNPMNKKDFCVEVDGYVNPKGEVRLVEWTGRISVVYDVLGPSRLGWAGGLHRGMRAAFAAAMPNEQFTFRNAKFRKMTAQEVSDITKNVMFTMEGP